MKSYVLLLGDRVGPCNRYFDTFEEALMALKSLPPAGPVASAGIWGPDCDLDNDGLTDEQREQCGQ